MNFSTSPLKISTAGRARTDEMKATWKDTRIWLAITHPSCKNARGLVLLMRFHPEDAQEKCDTCGVSLFVLPERSDEDMWGQSSFYLGRPEKLRQQRKY
jgi:hypothetical protein